MKQANATFLPLKVSKKIIQVKEKELDGRALACFYAVEYWESHKKVEHSLKVKREIKLVKENKKINKTNVNLIDYI